MFGVNKQGRDVLAPQFSRGKGKADWKATGSSNSEFAMRMEDMLAFLNSRAAPIIRAELEKNFPDKKAAEINKLVEEEIQTRAERLVREGIEKESGSASATAVIRTE